MTAETPNSEPAPTRWPHSTWSWRGLLQTQAAEVTKLRWEMGGIATALAAAFPIAWALYMEPAYGPAVSNTFQTATAIACLGAGTGLQTQQGIRSQKTGAAMDAVANRYGQIAGT
jgi:hypothetical protein